MHGKKMAIKDKRFLNPVKREKVRKVFQVHAEKCSVSGVSFITGTKYTIVRVCWTILLILALIAMSVHLGLLFIQFFNYQKQSLTDLDFNVLPFPAITVCNVNPVRKSKVDLASPMLQKLITSFDARRLYSLKQEFYKDNPMVDGHSVPYSHTFMVASPNIQDNSSFDDYPPNTNSSAAPASDYTDQEPPVYYSDPDLPLLPVYDDDPYDNTDRQFGDDLSETVAGDFDIDSFLNSGWDDLHTAAPPANYGFGGYGGEEVGAGPAFQGPAGQPDDNTATDSSNGKKDRNEDMVSMFSKIHSVFRILYSNEQPETKEDMGHSLHDMLIHCDFASNKCKASDFKMIPSDVYGNCYQLQHDTLIANDGPSSGANIILHLQLGEYITGFTPSKGIQVVVHERNTIPFPEEEGFSVAAGSHTMVGLKMHDISRLGSPYGDCSDVDDFKEKFGVVYTRQTCQKICQAKSILKKCGCFNPSGISLAHLVNYTGDFKPCKSESERYCVRDVQISLAEKQNKECFCTNPCKEKKYEKTISSRLWPDAEYARVFVNHICSTPRASRETCRRLQNKRDEQLTNEFLYLSVYYEDLNYQQLKEVPNYEAVKLVSDIGGTIGLWIGLSVLSVFEVVHLLISLFVTMCCPSVKKKFSEKKKNRSNGSNSTDIPL